MSAALRILTLFLILAGQAWASEPGEPFDCDDWVFLEPGLSCSDRVPYPCVPSANRFCNFSTYPATVIDLESNLYQIRWSVAPGAPSCGPWVLRRATLVRSDAAGQDVVVAYIEDRCRSEDPQRLDWLVAYGTGLLFDPSTGSVLLVLSPRCNGPRPGDCSDAFVEHGVWIASIDGLTSLSDIVTSLSSDPADEDEDGDRPRELTGAETTWPLLPDFDRRSGR